jgi:hypothetical protein
MEPKRMTERSEGGDRAPGLAVAITTMNSMRTIGRTLESVRSLAERIVVVDSGSTDGTVAFCEAGGAEVIHQEWLGHVAQKQLAIDCCADQPWVLLLDSDEALEPELQDAVRAAVADDDPAYDGWSVNRKLWFLGGWLHHTYQPEWRLRLARTARVRVAGVDPHDRLEVEGGTGRLVGDLRHDSWADVRELAERQVRYSLIASEQAAGGGSVLRLLFSPPAAFLKQLILRRGILDGRRGLIVAGLASNAAMLKHALIAARRVEERKAES